jgi:3-oxoacyl-[acyl-carrier protein] reductase
MIQDLQDKVVLVTGSSTGIGAAVAKAFAANGARVAVHSIESGGPTAEVVAAIRAGGGTAAAFGADVTVTEEVEKLVEDVVAEFGRIDILINNAGGMIQRALLAEMSDALFDDVLNLNTRHVIAASRAAVPHFLRQGGGVIINTASIAVRRGGAPGAGLYAGAKSFVYNLTRSLATEFAGQNIRVNAVAPGFIKTAFYDGNTSNELLESIRRNVPMGRLGQPEDLTGTYLFLASESLSGYITGQMIEVNGGLLMP